jgi:transposase InsO family protein
MWSDSTKKYHPFKDELCLVGKVILRNTKLVIPEELRRQVLELAHEGHPGISSMKQRLRTKVWWPGMDKASESVVRTCHGCQTVAALNPPEPLKRTELPEEAWQDIAVDFLGPLPSGHYLMVTVDYYSRFYEIDIMKKITAQEAIPRLKIHFARYGFPQTIRSDNGTQFSGGEFTSFCEEFGICNKFTTPVWPQANGEVERQNRSLLKRLKIAQVTNRDWKEELQSYLTLYRTTPHATTGKSPGEMMFKRKIRDKLPSYSVSQENLDSEVRERDAERKWKGKEYADRRSKTKTSDLQEGDMVLVKQQKTNKLSPTFNPTPSRIIRKEGSRVTIQTPTGVQSYRNSSFCKKFLANPDIPKKILTSPDIPKKILTSPDIMIKVHGDQVNTSTRVPSPESRGSEFQSPERPESREGAETPVRGQTAREPLLATADEDVPCRPQREKRRPRRYEV